MVYIVYITINLCNGKFYIGVHKTNPDVFDGYIGCGIYRPSNCKDKIPFHTAVKKYGYHNFKRTTIKIFPFTEEGKKLALELEKTLLSEELLRSKQCYNINQENASINKRSVFLYDLKGNYIRSFKSIKDAAKYINGCDKAIMNCCLGKANSSYGYYWSYKKEFNYKNNHKKIAQYTLSGKFLRVFDSTIEAESELQLNSISQAIKKKYQCGGYQWRFYENEDNISPLMNIFSRINNIPIIMIDNDKEIEYSSVKECAIKNNLSSSQINRVLKGIIKSHHGFKFRYKDEDIV